jgi:hypothetical protein
MTIFKVQQISQNMLQLQQLFVKDAAQWHSFYLFNIIKPKLQLTMTSASEQILQLFKDTYEVSCLSVGMQIFKDV